MVQKKRRGMMKGVYVCVCDVQGTLFSCFLFNYQRVGKRGKRGGIKKRQIVKQALIIFKYKLHFVVIFTQPPNVLL